MDVLVLLWVASVFAAICFFAAGLATHVAVARTRVAASDSADATILVETRARQQRSEARCAELEHALARANESLRKLHEEAARTLAEVDVKHEAAKAVGRQAAAELAAVRRSLVASEARARKAETELQGAVERVAVLSGELAAARVPKPAGPRSAAPRIATTIPRPVANAREATVEFSLVAQLGSLADECGYEVVVLSDAQGLLLAGVGDEQIQSTIAALSSVARELTTRAAEFVELRPKLIELTDDGGRTLRIRLFQWEQEPIALASLGIGHTEPTQEEDSLITVFPALIAAS